MGGWLGDLTRHDDAAAFASLAPRSQASVGNLDNYERGSGRFSSVYSRFAPSISSGMVLAVGRDLSVVALTVPGEASPAATAVPVRRVGPDWQVDPILDVGSYSFRPDDGATVGPLPIVAVQLDDPATRGRVWFDSAEAVAATTAGYQPRQSLAPGWHVVTIVLLRGEDVVARTLTLRVA